MGPKKVHRGGSFLCTDQYCSRYIVDKPSRLPLRDDAAALGHRPVEAADAKSCERHCLLARLAHLTTLLAAAGAFAQQPASESCSAAGTTSLKSEKELPPEPKPFGGVIKRDARESKPCWDPRIVPPKGAPNILLIMTDDAGFGVASTFGGVIPTPALDRIANMGLRYTNFNSTALCSPTRAALITGRNHHSLGFGVISEQATGYPGYNSIIPKDKATIARILKENGYS